MKLYFWLIDRVPRGLALVAVTIWLVVLIFLALFFAGEPSATFRYGNI